MNVDISWRTFSLRTAIACAAIFATVRMAMARDGVAGGNARSHVTVAGTLTGVNGTPMATFHFRHGSTEVCAPRVMIASLDSTTHAFSAEVPIDACPGLFDGSDVTVTVDVNGTPEVVSAQPINPVPYAHYASQYGTPDCPVGYALDRHEEGIVLCRKCRGPGMLMNCYDDVVRVGDGASAFWIDRYEASVWTTPDASAGSQRGLDAPNYQDGPSAVLPDGEYRGSPLYARSTIGSVPSAYVTWFQAGELCFASGKRLPSLREWLLAVRGTREPDPPELGDGREGRCITASDHALSVGNRAPTPGAIGCQSIWGAQDMIGNLREWLGDWTASPYTSTTPLPLDPAPWPTSYPRDLVVGVSSFAASDGNGTMRRVPSAIQVSGGFNDRGSAGKLYFNASSAPSDWNGVTGFRCVIPR